MHYVIYQEWVGNGRHWKPTILAVEWFLFLTNICCYHTWCMTNYCCKHLVFTCKICLLDFGIYEVWLSIAFSFKILFSDRNHAIYIICLQWWSFSMKYNITLLMFFQISILFATPRARTVKALTNCDLIALSKNDLDDIFKKFPKFCKFMTRVAKVCVRLTTATYLFFKCLSHSDEYHIKVLR